MMRRSGTNSATTCAKSFWRKTTSACHCRRAPRIARLAQDRFELGDPRIGVVAVSVDPKDRVRAFTGKIAVTSPVGCGMVLNELSKPALYVSEPRSEEKTDRRFAELGAFVVNPEGLLQVLDISNAPFARPDITGLAKVLTSIRNNDHPIRGRMVA